MTRRAKWTLRTFGPAVVFGVAAVVFLLAADWGYAAILASCAVSLALSGQIQRYVYRAGFWAGALDLVRALKTGDSPVMHGKPPEPWDELPGDETEDPEHD